MKLVKFIPFLFLVIFIFFVFKEFSGPQKKGENERFVIGLEVSPEDVINNLKEKGFVRSKSILRTILNLKKWQGKIEPGAYQISKSMNVFKLAQTLISGPYQKWVIIPPGKRKEQVALILQKTLNWPFSTARNFINIAEEGYLYPDTYLIDTKADPQQVVQRLMINFNEKFDADLQKELLGQDIRNDTAVKIASLIERESGGDNDKLIIAGIIWNRLLKGTRLEIDATVQYAIASEKLSDAGLQSLDNFYFWPMIGPGVVKTVNSPYNTYLNDGLPPGPICSPGISSIKAVANSTETDALYYLHSADKQIHTAKTYEEHLENIKNYLQSN